MSPHRPVSVTLLQVHLPTSVRRVVVCIAQRTDGSGSADKAPRRGLGPKRKGPCAVFDPQLGEGWVVFGVDGGVDVRYNRRADASSSGWVEEELKLSVSDRMVAKRR